MRILVTGSRKLSGIHLALVRNALVEALAGMPAEAVGPPVLVHGAAHGADTLAAVAANGLGWEVEPHPADWDAPCWPECRPDCRKTRDDGSEYCSAAGHYRNQRMIDLGADVVVAFFKTGARNSGTRDCVRRAKAAGIRVQPFPKEAA